jgi:hypothetical protein
VIGWENAVKGYLSKSWTQLALLEMDDRKKGDLQVANNRMRRTIKALHEFSGSRSTVP